MVLEIYSEKSGRSEEIVCFKTGKFAALFDLKIDLQLVRYKRENHQNESEDSAMQNLHSWFLSRHEFVERISQM